MLSNYVLCVCCVISYTFMLQETWIGIIHHVCREHEWDEGECQHGPLTQLESDKTIIAKDSKAAKELRAIVFDKKWLKSLNFYVFF